MSIIKLNPDNFENYSIITKPSKEYSSSSLGITGSVNLFPRRSNIEKEIQDLKDFNRRHFKDFSLENFRGVIKKNITDSIVSGTFGDFNIALSTYMREVNSQSFSSIKSQSIEIIRFKPSDKLEQNFLKFKTFKETLLKKHRVPDYVNYAFTNYNSLNFFTASSVSDNSAILYPNSSSEANNTKTSGSYSIGNSFTFDFYLNPRYKTTEQNVDFKAGTLFHLSSSYAVSLITGSLKDENGKPEGFRLMIQASHSADTAPSKVDTNNLGTFPNDLTFLSDDNSLRYNHWHHCIIRWGGKSLNNGTGSFVIDNKKRGEFVIPSSSIQPSAYSAPQGNPDVLFVGNYYEGSNSGNDKQILFFAQTPATRDGVINMHPNSTLVEPNNFKLNHPLNAEVHELKIFNEYRNNTQIFSSSFSGLDNTAKTIFYVPPFFVREGPNRKASSGVGGILTSPFRTKDGETNTPVNVDLSFRVGVRDVNLENFTRDFSTKNYPRLINLTSSQITNSDDASILSASQFMYATASFVKRNLTILPCDNGKFIPNFNLLKSGSERTKPKKKTPTEWFINDLSNLDLSLVSLKNLIDSGSLPDKAVSRKTLRTDNNILQMTDLPGGSIRNELIEPEGNPSKYSGRIAPFMSLHYKTRDEDYRDLVLFDISNIFYGERIEPKTFEIKDNNLSGSNNQIKIHLKDDGNGKLYRANSKTPNAKFNCVGNIFYNEGIIGIFNPSLSFFGEKEFNIKFKGRQTVNTQKINILCESGMFNSSSNTSYDPLMSASLDANVQSEKFVLISGINFMDENLNVIAKTSFASPIEKKQSDRILFRISNDW